MNTTFSGLPSVSSRPGLWMLALVAFTVPLPLRVNAVAMGLLVLAWAPLLLR